MSEKTKPSPREIQKRNTQESGSIKLIEKHRRTVSKLRSRDIPCVVVENIVTELSQEIIRLRRGLINERTHRNRLAAGILPKLKSKCNEVRTLRKKLYGKETRVKEPKRKCAMGVKVGTYKETDLDDGFLMNGTGS